jgi:penicillin-insensitive murein endopeptidase
MKPFCLLVALSYALTPLIASAATWSDVREPAPGPPRAIGSYAAGCLQGAIPLPPEGPGFVVMRRSRHRFFAHPSLIQYLHDLAATVARQKAGVLLIGDLGQPRGGPMPSGHRSHQNGLDADIWFWLPPDERELTTMGREIIGAPTMLAANGGGLNAQQWSRRQVDVLRTATTPDAVSRVFVNPVIKRALCQQFPGAPWLRKLRPWWGHDAHFHVRLHCPFGEEGCQSQDSLPVGDGCGADLAWWFSEEARQPKPRVDLPPVVLPAACEEVLRK